MKLLKPEEIQIGKLYQYYVNPAVTKFDSKEEIDIIYSKSLWVESKNPNQDRYPLDVIDYVKVNDIIMPIKKPVVEPYKQSFLGHVQIYISCLWRNKIGFVCFNSYDNDNIGLILPLNMLTCS